MDDLKDTDLLDQELCSLKDIMTMVEPKTPDQIHEAYILLDSAIDTKEDHTSANND